MKNKPGKRTLSSLKGVHPALSAVVMLAMSRSHHDFSVVEGVRSLETQRGYFKKGVSKTLKSNHLLQSDGFGHAVDCYPVGWKVVDEIPEHAWHRLASEIKSAADDMGVIIEWGYDLWGWDMPHFQFKGIK